MVEYKQVESVRLIPIKITGQTHLYLDITLNGQLNRVNIDKAAEQFFEQITYKLTVMGHIAESLKVFEQGNTNFQIPSLLTGTRKANIRPSRATNLENVITPPFVAVVSHLTGSMYQFDIEFEEEPSFAIDKYGGKIFTEKQRILIWAASYTQMRELFTDWQRFKSSGD
jgi:hypothetical protein